MSHYKITPGQQIYLKRKYAAEREAEKGCDCPGCDVCSGNQRNCKCDEVGISGLREAQKVASLERQRIKLARHNPIPTERNDPHPNQGKAQEK